MMDVVFSELATLELNDAVAFYELEHPGLGARFKKEIFLTLKRIIQYPTAWAMERNEIRRCLVYKFPYKILYSVEKDCILILAIAHQHRKPDYWIDRLKS